MNNRESRPLGLSAYVTILMLGVSAMAGEVTVKNDSIVNNDLAVIVGDFIQGEQAAVRLTSPCDGAIVAVQILWLEGTPGHGQSLESAIHILDGSTFPTPGDEWLLLEGPVMTPGYWNEFRYSDEAQTIPIHVAVSQGQRFYVSLEFYNPTDVGNGGPSVVRDRDGFHSGCNALYGFVLGQWNWWDFNGFPVYLAGDIAIRAVIDCPGPTGACCHLNGTCTDSVEQADCVVEFGAVWTQGQTCAQVSCTPRGACCRFGGCLDLTTPSQCASISGSYAGDGTDCAHGACTAGACCLPTGECQLDFGFQCAALGGTFQGPGTSCSPNPCPQPRGACCFGTFCVADQTQAGCTSAGGTWSGMGSTCADDNGNGVPDACEVQPGDMNGDGLVNDFDITPFVYALTHTQAVFEARYPSGCYSCGDVNNDGVVNNFDITAFVHLLTRP